jgi:lipid-A-disaccharide synthase
MNKLLALSSAEASGDAHAVRLLDELRPRLPGWRFAGMGGAVVAEAGIELWSATQELAVVGLQVHSASKQLPALYRVWGRKLAEERPAALLCVDYGGFHLLLMRLAHRMGIPTIHYIPSKLWTWGSFRATFYRHWVDLVLSIFPFEETFLRKLGINAHYVGNPVVDSIAPWAEQRKSDTDKLSLPANPLVAIFPGSRRSELEIITPLLLQAAELMQKAMPELRFAVAAAPGVSVDLLHSVLSRTNLPLETWSGDSRELMLAADVGLIKSGTSTLEAALLGLPHIIIYRTSRITWEIGVRLAQVEWLGLPNLILNRDAAPEYLQDKATPPVLAETALRLLQDQEYRQHALGELAEVREKVGPAGAGKRAAEAVVAFLAERGKL